MSMVPQRHWGAVAYRFRIVEHGGVGPDEVQDGGIPVLRHGHILRI